MLSAGLLSAQVDVPTFVQGAHQGTPSEQGSKCPECTGGFIEVNMFDPRIEGSDFKWDVHIRFHPDTPIPAAPVNRLGGVAVYFKYNTQAFTNPKDNCSYENDATQELNTSFTPKYNNVINVTTPEIWARLNQSNSLAGAGSIPDVQAEGFFIVLTHEYQRLYTVSCPIADTTQLAGIEINYRGWNRIFTPTGNGAADAANQQGFVRLVSTSFARFPLNGAPAVVSQRLYGGNDGVELELSNQPTTESPNLQFVGSTTGNVYELTSRISGSTLFVTRTDPASPILEDIEVRVAPSGLGNAVGSYESTTTITTLPGASAYDPIVTDVLFEKGAPNNNLHITVGPQKALTDAYTLTSASTEDIIVDIIFRDRDGVTSTHVESIVSIDEEELGASVTEAITLTYAVDLPDVVADGDLTAEIIFGANSITLTEGDNTGSLRPRHLSGFDIEVPDNVDPVTTYDSITLTKLDDQSGLGRGEINNSIVVEIIFSEMITNLSSADSAIEIVAFDVDGDEVGTIEIEESDLTANADNDLLTITKEILSLEDHVFYGVRIINAGRLRDSSDNPVSANLETLPSERVRVPRLQIVEVGDPTDNTIKEATTPATVLNFSLDARDGDGDLITGAVVWSLTGTNADLFAIDETGATVGITLRARLLDFEGSDAKDYELTVSAVHASEGEAETVVRFTLDDVLESVEFVIVGSADFFDENTTTNTNTGRTVEGITLRSSVDGTSRQSAFTTYRIVNTVPFEIVALTPPVNGEGVVRQTQAIDYETNEFYELTVEATVIEDGVTVTSEQEQFFISINNLFEEITLASGSDTQGTVLERTTDTVAGLSLGIEDEAGSDLSSAVVWSLADSAGGLFTIDASSGEISGTEGTNYEPDTIPSGYNPATPRQYPLTVRATTTQGIPPELTVDIPVTVVMENVLEQLVRGSGTNTAGTAFELFDNEVQGLNVIIRDERGASVDDLVWAFAFIDDPAIRARFTINPATGVITAVGSANNLGSQDADGFLLDTIVSKGAIQSAPIAVRIDIINVLAELTLSDSDVDTNRLAENATGVVEGITLIATDERDQTVTDLTWTIVTNSAGNHFSIDENTGVLSVVNAFDFETGGIPNVVVQASKAQEGSGTIIESPELTVSVNIDNVLESVELELVGTPDTIDENSPTGTRVPGLTLRTTVDGVDRAPVSGVTYSLTTVEIPTSLISVAPSTTPNEAFLQVSGGIDYEAYSEIFVTVAVEVVEEGVTLQQSSTRVTTIIVNNVLEAFTRRVPSVSSSIAEHSTGPLNSYNPFSLVEDENEDLFNLDSGIAWSLSNNSGGRFTIDPASGVISGTQQNNYEPFDLGGPIPLGYDPNTIPSYTIEVTAEIETFTQSIPITVQIQNRVESFTITNTASPVGYVFESVVNRATITPRLSVDVGTGSGNILRVIVIDERGATRPNASTQLELLDSSLGIPAQFVIDSNNNYFETRAVSGVFFDFDDVPQITFRVRATYTGPGALAGIPTPTDTSEVLTVTVVEVNEALTIAEDNSVGGVNSVTWIENLIGELDTITLEARDEDASDITSAVVWSLTTNPQNADGDNHFSIDADGTISVAEPLVYSEDTTRHMIVVQASQENTVGTNIESNELTITVNIDQVAFRVDSEPAMPNSLDFWVIIDFGRSVEIDTAILANITNLSVTGGILTGVTIVGQSATFPAGLPSRYNNDRSIYLRVEPEGDFDRGEALGTEEIVITLPGDSNPPTVFDSALLSSPRGDGVVVPNSVTVNPPDNSDPEIIGFKFTEQDITLTETGNIGLALLYELELTEPIDNAEADRLVNHIAIEATASTKGSIASSFGEGRTDPVLENRAITDFSGFVNSVESRSGRHFVQIFHAIELSPEQLPMVESYYAVYTPPASEADRVVEDCATSSWYSAREDVRNSRSTPCYSEEVVANPFDSFSLFGRNDALELVFTEDVTLSASAQVPNSNTLSFRQSGNIDRTTVTLGDDSRTVLITATESADRTLPIGISFGDDIQNAMGQYRPELNLILPGTLSYQPLVESITFEPGSPFNLFRMVVGPSAGTGVLGTENRGSTTDIIDRIILTNNTGDAITIDGEQLVYVLNPTVLPNTYTIGFKENSGFPDVADTGDYTATFIFGNVLAGLSTPDSSIIRSRQLQATDVSIPDNVDPQVTFDFDFNVAVDQAGLQENFEFRYDLTLVVAIDEVVSNTDFSNAADNFRLRQISSTNDENIKFIDIRANGELVFETSTDLGRSTATIIKSLVWNTDILGYRALVRSQRNGKPGVLDNSQNPLMGTTRFDLDTESTISDSYVYSELANAVRIHQIAVDGTSAFVLVLEFDERIDETDLVMNGLNSISVSVSSGPDHLVTSVRILGRYLGSAPDAPTISGDFVKENSIILLMDPAGSGPDSGEAAGTERITLTLRTTSTNLFTSASGLDNPPLSLVLQLEDTSNPEIVGFHSGVSTNVFPPGDFYPGGSGLGYSLLINLMEDGNTLIRVISIIELSEAIDTDQIQALAQDIKIVANENLSPEFANSFTSGIMSTVSGDLPVVSIVEEAHSDDGIFIAVRNSIILTPEQLARTRSIYAVYTPTASTEFIEDCQADGWYSPPADAPRLTTRTTDCYAQRFAVNPIASYSLFDRNEALVLMFQQDVGVGYDSSQPGQTTLENLLNPVITDGSSLVGNFNEEHTQIDERTVFTRLTDIDRVIETQQNPHVILFYSADVPFNNVTYLAETTITYPPSRVADADGNTLLEPRVSSLEFIGGHPQNAIRISFEPISPNVPLHAFPLVLENPQNTNIIEHVILADNDDDTPDITIAGENLMLEGTFDSSLQTFNYGFSEFPVIADSQELKATFVFNRNLVAGADRSVIRSRQVEATNVAVPDNIDPEVVLDLELAPSADQDGLASGEIRYELTVSAVYNEIITNIAVSTLDSYRLDSIGFGSAGIIDTQIADNLDIRSTNGNTIITLTKTVVWESSIAGYRVAIQTVDGVTTNQIGLTDGAGNPLVGAVNTDPETGETTAQPFVYSRVQPVINVTPVSLGDDTNNFWVVIDFGTVLMTSTSTEESLSQIKLDLNVSDTITSATIVGIPELGLPEGVTTINGLAVTDTNTLHFEVRPTGTLDDGESATGADQFAVRLPVGLGTIGGNAVPTVPLIFNALSNGRPEITSFMLESQAKTITPAGRIGDITYHMIFTEGVSIASMNDFITALSVYRSTAEQESLNTSLASGATMGGITGVSNATTMTEIDFIINQPDPRTIAITLSMLAETNPASSDTQSYVLALNSEIFSNRAITSIADSDEALEDCQGLVWYGGSVRTETRTSECIAQDSAEAQPAISFPQERSLDELKAANELAPNVSSNTGVARVARAVLLNSSVADVTEHLGIRGLDNIGEINSSRELATLKEEVTIDTTWSFKTDKGFRLLTDSGDTYEVTRPISIVAGYGFTERIIFAYDNTETVEVTIANNTYDEIGTITTREITFSRELTTSDEAQIRSESILHSSTSTLSRNSNKVDLPVNPAGETVWRIANAWTKGMSVGRLATDNNVYTLGNGFSSIRVIGVEASRAEAQPLQVESIISSHNSGAITSYPYVVTDNPVRWVINLRNRIEDDRNSGVCTHTIESEANTCINYTVKSIPSSGAQTYISSDFIAFVNGRIELDVSRFSTATDATLIGDLQFVNFELAVDYQSTSGGEIRSLVINVDVPLFDTPPDVSLLRPYECLRGNAVSTVEVDGEESISIQALDDVCLQRSYQTLAYEYDIASNGGTPTTTNALLILPESDKADNLFGDLPELPNNDEPIAYVNFQMSEVRPGYDGRVPTQNGIGSVLIDLPDLEEGERWAFYKLIDGEWRTFDTSHLGMTKSTAGLQCPSDSGDSESPYRDGSGNPNGGSAGSNCALVEIVDGEENDANRRTAGIIVDPLAIARATGGGGRRGGGGAMSVTELLGLFGLMIIASLVQTHRRRRVLATAEATRRQN